jgi:hypothetical protein
MASQEEGALHTPERQAVGADSSSADGVRRILVVANETVAGEALLAEIRRRAASSDLEVLVVCPALNSRIRHWLSDEDSAREEARRRLGASLTALGRSGIDARGDVGDADPVQAIEDALRAFRADEIIISTHPPGRSNWLEKRVVERARLLRPDLTIGHIVVDLGGEGRRDGGRHESAGETPAQTDPI